MISGIIQAIVAVFEFFNRIATRIREIRIEREIKSKITNLTRDVIAKKKKMVKDKLDRKYSPPDGGDK